MITKFYQNVKINGSSFVSPAYGWSGTRATIKYDSQLAQKNRAKFEK